MMKTNYRKKMLGMGTLITIIKMKLAMLTSVLKSLVDQTPLQKAI